MNYYFNDASAIITFYYPHPYQDTFQGLLTGATSIMFFQGT